MVELCGQRNAIDGPLVQIVAELERDELCGATGARSTPTIDEIGLARATETAVCSCPPVETYSS